MDYRTRESLSHLMKDRLNSVLDEMATEIERRINEGYYSIWQFLADPSVYMDSSVMKKYINVEGCRLAVEKRVKEKFDFILGDQAAINKYIDKLYSEYYN